MKKLLGLPFVTTLLLMLNLGTFTQNVFGQFAPPPSPPPDAKGAGGNQGPLNAGAPIGEGTWILITLVVGYGIHTIKVYKKNHDSDLQ